MRCERAATCASSSAAYNNTGAAKYLPSSTTNNAGNALQYTYNGQGNQLTAAQGTSGPQAMLTYNSDGTVATSASPGAAASVTTGYAYNSDHNLTGMTPPNGSGLAARNATWDGFGRLATVTDGVGNTVTYTYDNADRITKVHNSAAGTTDVSYTYDALGRLTKRVDGVGTTTYGYDDLGHLTSTSNSYGGGTISYTYDLAGALATQTSAAGTTTYGYDAAHFMTSMAYPQNGGTQYTRFANDANGRRTDTWLQSDANHTAWAAHSHLSYDSSGRVTAAVGENGPATGPTKVLNQTVCYSAGAVAPACPTTASADRSKAQWVSDSVTGETATYTYDGSNRLIKVIVSGGNNPRTYTYGYDAAGNRITTSVTGSSPSNQTLTFNSGNQITTSGYAYNGAGDQTATPTQTTAYTPWHQQATAVVGGKTTTYTYAGTSQNEVLKESTAGGSTYQLTYGRPDKNGLPEIESVTVGSATGYVFHDPSGLPVMLQTNSALTTLYMFDAIGNPAVLANSVNTTSYNLRFDPYGAATRIDGGTNNGGWIQNPYVFQAGIQDRATGLIKFGQRWYNPGTGTWTQQDSLNVPLSPTNANRYAYAGGDPMNVSDPAGFYGWDDFWGSVGETIGAAAGAAVVAATCVETAIVGCVVAGAVLSSFGGSVGGAVGAAVGGGSSEDIGDEAIDGAIFGPF